MKMNCRSMPALIAMAALVVSLGATWLEASEPPQVDVFVNGDGGYPVYRIPSLVCTPKGTLLAFCEGRSAGDQSPTDIVLRRSGDGGRTWQPMQVIVKALPDAAMNPTAIVDRVTGAVVLVCGRFPQLPKGQNVDHGGVARAAGLGRDSITTWLTTSRDEGVTWSAPIDITAMTKKPEWRETGHGPGVGIQTRSGRLVVPCFETRLPESPGYPWGVSWNYAIYSDDHGQTWRLSDNEVGPCVNETQMVELADGTLMLNMRSDAVKTGDGYAVKGCRVGAVSRDGGKTWSEPFDIRDLPDPNCQASILRYTWADKQGKSRILFSSPAAEGRLAGTIRVSYDEGKTWPVAKVIHKDYFGYSCLAGLPDGTIGCVFETAGCSKIVFAGFSLAWLTDGKDSWKP